jgi:hypothetical protein
VTIPVKDPITELVDTLAALRRDVDRLSKESAETRSAAQQATAAAFAGQKASEAPRTVTVDASAVGKALTAVSASLTELRDQVRALDAAHYRDQVNSALSTAQADLTCAVQGVERSLVATAHAVDATARRAANHLTGKLTLAIGAIVLAAGFLIWTTGTLATWWQRATRDALAADIERLQDELPVLQARAAEWANRAGKAVLVQCGASAAQAGVKPTPGRLCVRIDLRAPAYGTNGEYRILDGY